MGGPCRTHGKYEKRNKILVGKPEGKRLLGKPKRGWVDNIRINHTEIRWEVVDWYHKVQDREQWRTLVDKAMNFCSPQKAGIS
jgi:hypothetical protein